MIVTLFIIISVVFILTRFMPDSEIGDPNLDPTLRAMLIQYYGLDRPVHEQYFTFMRRLVFEQDLGTSTKLWPRQSVMSGIMVRMPITIQLNLLSSIIVYPLGFFFGILMGIKHNTKTDHTLNVFMMIAISVPMFVFAALLQYFLAFRLGAFPILLSTDRPNEWIMSWPKFHSMILPALAMSFGPIMGIARVLRGELSETLTSDFMLLAKTKGLTHKQATLRHAMRNSFVPMTGMFVGVFLSLLTGSLIIERFFSIPGVGGVFVSAVNLNDTPVMMGWLLLFTFLSLAGIIITDLLYGVVDPRIRMGGRKNEA